MTALLTEAHAMGVTTVDLLASHDGEPLYRSLGFSDPAHRFLRLSSH